MAEEFKVEIFDPSGKRLEERARAVIVPTVQGEVGILPDHARYTTLLGIGILEIQSSDKEATQSKKLVISGGAADFADNSLRVLADIVDLPDEMRDLDYSNSRADLEEKLAQGSAFDPVWQQYHAKLKRIEAIDLLLASTSHRH